MKPRVAYNRLASGQALIEFALVLPLLFLLIINVINFGGMLYAWITVSNAARTGAQYLIRGKSTVGSPNVPTAAQVSLIVTQELLSLPNQASAQVNVCTNNASATPSIVCSGGTLAIPTDPEPATYVLGSVDVTYTYRPFIPFWNFPALGVYTTLPPTAIHRRAVMRIMQ